MWEVKKIKKSVIDKMQDVNERGTKVIYIHYIYRYIYIKAAPSNTLKYVCIILFISH